MRPTRYEVLMGVAVLMSFRGTCRRRRVGAVIAKNDRIVSSGYVGAPTNMPHCTPTTCTPEKPCERTVHAEVNAIAYAARAGVSTEGTWIYTTTSPCKNCLKLIVNSGIIKVVYLEEYRIPPCMEYPSLEIVQIEPSEFLLSIVRLGHDVQGGLCMGNPANQFWDFGKSVDDSKRRSSHRSASRRVDEDDTGG